MRLVAQSKDNISGERLAVHIKFVGATLRVKPGYVVFCRSWLHFPEPPERGAAKFRSRDVLGFAELIEQNATLVHADSYLFVKLSVLQRKLRGMQDDFSFCKFGKR